MKARKVPVSVLVNNAGAIVADSMKVNHLAHFGLTCGLLYNFQLAAQLGLKISVINVSSCAHMDGSLTLSSALEAMSSNAENNRVNNSNNTWPAYAQSKAANAVFSIALSRLLTHPLQQTTTLLPIRIASYHPGVMLTDLWTPAGNPSPNSVPGARGDNDGRDESNTEVIRLLLCCCAKHPIISAAGIASLASPGCYPYSCCISAGTGTAADCANKFYDILFGSNGGYYQQCCCCTVIPVRPSPLITSANMQNKLWNHSLQAIQNISPSLYQYLEENSPDIFYENTAKDGLASGSGAQLDKYTLPSSSCCQLSPAYPCTEVLAIAPYCPCIAMMC